MFIVDYFRNIGFFKLNESYDDKSLVCKSNELFNLPKEIVQIISLNLDVKDQNALAQVNKKLNQIIESHQTRKDLKKIYKAIVEEEKHLEEDLSWVVCEDSNDATGETLNLIRENEDIDARKCLAWLSFAKETVDHTGIFKSGDHILITKKVKAITPSLVFPLPNKRLDDFFMTLEKVNFSLKNGLKVGSSEKRAG
jgi:hypothetical protein